MFQRNLRGLLPVAALKTRLNWEMLPNPFRNAISEIPASVSFSISPAFMTQIDFLPYGLLIEEY